MNQEFCFCCFNGCVLHIVTVVGDAFVKLNYCRHRCNTLNHSNKGTWWYSIPTSLNDDVNMRFEASTCVVWPKQNCSLDQLFGEVNISLVSSWSLFPKNCNASHFSLFFSPAGPSNDIHVDPPGREEVMLEAPAVKLITRPDFFTVLHSYDVSRLFCLPFDPSHHLLSFLIHFITSHFLSDSSIDCICLNKRPPQIL